MKNNKVVLLLLSAFSLFLIDRFTKYLALTIPPEGIFYFPALGLKPYLNPRLAFSLPLNQIVINILIILILIVLIILWSKFYQAKNFFLLWPLSLLMIGAFSNLLDRFRFQAVIDFIDIWFWPAFNLADLYIVVGCCWLLSQTLPKSTK